MSRGRAAASARVGALLFAVLVAMFPFWWMLVTSLKQPVDIFKGVSLLPQHATSDNYHRLFSDYHFGDAQGLFRFYGDANGDRHVDIADFALFSGTFNLSTGQTGFLDYFDFNGDGHIDIADFGQFSIRFFTPLP